MRGRGPSESVPHCAARPPALVPRDSQPASHLVRHERLGVLGSCLRAVRDGDIETCSCHIALSMASSLPSVARLSRADPPTRPCSSSNVAAAASLASTSHVGWRRSSTLSALRLGHHHHHHQDRLRSWGTKKPERGGGVRWITTTAAETSTGGGAGNESSRTGNKVWRSRPNRDGGRKKVVVKGYDLATAAEASTGAVVDGGGEAVAKPSATQTRSTGTSSRGKGPTDAPTAKAAAAAAAVSKTSSSLDLDDGYQSGDPLGRKRLGKDVVRWLSRGMAAMASDIAAAEASGERLGFLDDLESGVTLVTLAQPYLGAAAMPMGHEAVCLKVSSHYPTLFDHLQRELQGALQALQDQGVLEKWQDAESWLFLKKLARSGWWLLACLVAKRFA